MENNRQCSIANCQFGLKPGERAVNRPHNISITAYPAVNDRAMEKPINTLVSDLCRYLWLPSFHLIIIWILSKIQPYASPLLIIFLSICSFFFAIFFDAITLCRNLRLGIDYYIGLKTGVQEQTRAIDERS
jgi:hypothetical protein